MDVRPDTKLCLTSQPPGETQHEEQAKQAAAAEWFRYGFNPANGAQWDFLCDRGDWDYGHDWKALLAESEAEWKQSNTRKQNRQPKCECLETKPEFWLDGHSVERWAWNRLAPRRSTASYTTIFSSARARKWYDVGRSWRDEATVQGRCNGLNGLLLA